MTQLPIKDNVLARVVTSTGPKLLFHSGGQWNWLPENLTLTKILNENDPLEFLTGIKKSVAANLPLVNLAPPIEDQEVWAAGVTYFSSRRARMTETRENTMTLYDRVYGAQRPQIFPKAIGRNVVTENDALILRDDSRWIVPEPELVLIHNSRGTIVGYTVGNDLSCRDLEGENPLYQPQAKIWTNSCSMAPFLELIHDCDSLLSRTISLEVERNGKTLFNLKAKTSEIVRPLPTLSKTLFAYRSFNGGAYLFTGTGIVPEDSFSLQQNDVVKIALSDFGGFAMKTVSLEMKRAA